MMKSLLLDKNIIIPAGLMILCVVGFCWIIGAKLAKYSNEANEISKIYVGQRVVLDGDTSTIVEYQHWGDRFHTSGGDAIDGGNIEKFIIKTEEK